MLVLTRKIGQSIRLQMPDGQTAWIILAHGVGRSGAASIAIQAPETVRIVRGELVSPDEQPALSATPSRRRVERGFRPESYRPQPAFKPCCLSAINTLR